MNWIIIFEKQEIGMGQSKPVRTVGLLLAATPAITH